MRTVGHSGFSYSASLDAFLVEGARAGKLGFYYTPVAPSRGTSLQPRVYFLDAQQACPDARIRRRESADVGICTVQAQAGVQPIEFVLNVYPDRYRGFASRPNSGLSRTLAAEGRHSLPDTTTEEAAETALERAMVDWLDDRQNQMKYFLAVMNPNGNRGSERTLRVVGTAKSLSSSLEPVLKTCASVTSEGLQAALKPLAQSNETLRDYVLDAEKDLQSARKPAGFAP
jgi:hypothetical protein